MKLKVVRSSRGFDGNNMPIRKWRMASGELRIGSLATRHSPFATIHSSLFLPVQIPYHKENRQIQARQNRCVHQAAFLAGIAHITYAILQKIGEHAVGNVPTKGKQTGCYAEVEYACFA